ncbi:MAG: TMEM165/GDT1 family protein [Candidatus Omnitrophica bacterium]|nr:TMEM165/GDT1 family protein [Candidatus Omnitrophota bacterium]
MNFKVFFAAFSTIFVAELFDKTELAVLSLAAKEKSKLDIFLGAMAAFFVATLLAILFGHLLERFVNPKVMRYVSASIFFVAGTLILFDKL